MKAAIYVRVSTSEQVQEGYSIPAQISLLSDYSKSLGYDIYKIYQDAGISGKNIKDRPALKQLLDDTKNKKFNTVIVWKLSRLSRSLLDLLSIVDTFNRYNVSFQSHSEKFDTSTPMGKMLLQLLGSIAEFERNTIVENVKMGLGQRFKEGYSKGAIPFGYKHKDKKAVIDSEKAEMVGHVFNTYLDSPDGNCITALAEEFNLKGYRTRTGGLWSRIAIRDMLQNHFYAGFVRTGIHSHGYSSKKDAAVIKGCHEPIISEEIFNAVNQKLKSKKCESVIRYPDNDSILTGLIVCPLCGAKMFALNTYNHHKRKDGTVAGYPVRMYRCTNKDKGKGICKGIYISSNKIEPFFMEALKQLISVKDLNEIKEMSKFEKNDDLLKEVDHKLREVTLLKNRYFSLFETGKVRPELFADKINEILANIENLEKERDEIFKVKSNTIDPEEMKSKITDFITMFNLLPNEEKKSLLRYFIADIVITKDKHLDYILFKNGLKFYYHK